MAKTAQKRLGDILLEQELVDADQLAEAMTHQRRTGKPLPYVFVELGYVSEEDIVVTERLSEAGRILGIEVLDHIILGRQGFVSLRELGHV